MNECITHLTIRVLGFGGGPCVIVVEHTFNVSRYNVKKIMELVVEDFVLSRICSCTMCETNILETNVFFSFSILVEGGVGVSQPHFEVSVRMRLTLPKVGTWSPLGLLQLQSSNAEVKTPRLEVFFIPLERP